MRRFLPVLIFAAAAQAQIGQVQVLGTTATQAVLAYTAPDEQACTVEVSTSASYRPLVPDVDPGLFPGEDRDTRASSVVQGRQRVFVAGHRKVDRVSDGRKYSRALEANTTHYFRITCGAERAAGTFQTANIPLGATYMDALESDPANPGGYLWPSSNVLTSEQMIDPATGVLAKNVNAAGWAYAGTTGATGVGFAAAEDPAGKWQNTAGALGDDSSYASYSGKTQDWLWLRLSNYPDNGTFSANSLAFQNLNIKAYCSGSDCQSGGQAVEVCITRLGIDENGAHCEPPVLTVNLPATQSVTTVCGDGAPCRNPAKPGDVITYDQIPKTDWKPGAGYVYNTASDYKRLMFTSAEDCRRLRTGDRLRIYLSNSGGEAQPSVTGLSCGSTPPQASTNSAAVLDYNGTAGVPFYYSYGIKDNQRYGILIRKKSTSADSTIYLNYASWRAASHVAVSFGWGSGGFNKLCSAKPDANGFFHCKSGENVITGIRTEPDGQLTVRFLGVSYFYGQAIPGVASGFRFCGGALNDWLWDEEDANVFYCAAPSSYPAGGTVLLKATYTGNDIACGEGGACAAPVADGSDMQRWPQLPMSLQVLTPCLNQCAAAADDYTVEGQMARYTSGKALEWSRAVFPRCGVEAAQGKTVVFACRQGEQDTYTWAFGLDLGNGRPIGSGFAGRFGNTQQVIAAAPIFARKPSRWCTLHTYQNIRAEGIATLELQNEKIDPFTVTQTGDLAACAKGGCAACPSIQVDGYDYTGKKVCGTLNTSSAWNSGWGTAPNAYAPGEPVSNLATLHWLQPLAAGDILAHGGELVKIIQKAGPSQYVVERGFGKDQSYMYPRAHGAGSVWTTYCANDLDPATTRGSVDGVHWFFLQDADATGASTYFYTNFVNHALGRDGVRVAPSYEVSLAPFTASEMPKAKYRSGIGLPATFAGKRSSADGNTIEKHPSYGQEAAAARDQRWFIDGHPYLFMGNASNAAFSAVPIEGNLYRYRASAAINPKHYGLAAFTGERVLRDISGPGSTITGGVADAYTVCHAAAAGECIATAAAGEVYVNVPTLDRTVPWCKEGEFYSGWRDICVGNFNALGGSYAQWGLPFSSGMSVRNFAAGRVLSRLYEPYRGSATANAKPTPDGKWVMLRSNLILRLPPFPAQDGVVRSTFAPVAVTLHPPAAGADNAVVEFGYTPELECTSRHERCVATKAEIDEANPFVWPSEKGGDAGVAGMPCSTGCTISIPGISRKVLYYRYKYRDAANRVLATGPVQVSVVP